MASFALESLLILVLIIANGIFSGSEIAVVSARKVRLEQQAQQGNRGAQVALRLANSPNDFLSTVQIGITLIGILSGAVGGATIAQRIAPLIGSVPGLQSYAQWLSVVIVVTIITYLSLVIGELAPKRIALNDPERIACAVSRPMRLLSRATAPLVKLLGASTEWLIRILGIHGESEPGLTEEEIKALIRQGAESGVFEEAEHEMVERVFRLGDRPIRAIMTPRTEIAWLDLEAPTAELIEQVTDSHHSRFPVGRGTLDQCLGVMRGTHLLASHLATGGADIESLIQEPLYVASSARALSVLEEFKKSGIHVALVSDEYGGVEGLVTLRDLMEAIVGELPSLEDHEDPLVIHREDGSWLMDGLLPIGDFKQLTGTHTLPDEHKDTFHTLGGFVMHFLGRIPRTGETFAWNGLRFEVVDMDGKRIDKLSVSLAAPGGPTPKGAAPQEDQPHDAPA